MANLYWYQAAATYAWDDHGTPGPWWDDLASLGGGHSDVRNTVGPIAGSAVIMLGAYRPTAGPANPTTVASLDSTGMAALLPTLLNLTVTGAMSTGNAAAAQNVRITSCGSLAMAYGGGFKAGTAGSATFNLCNLEGGIVTGLAAFTLVDGRGMASGTVGSATFDGPGGGMSGGTVTGLAAFTVGTYLTDGTAGSATFATGTKMYGGTVTGAVTFAPGSEFLGGVIGSFDLTAALEAAALYRGLMTV